MGLDISAYDNIEFKKKDIDDSLATDEDYDLVYIYKNTDFPETSEGFDNGYYEHKGKNSTDFRAGSYGGYNRWRENLCLMANGITADKVFADAPEFKDLDKDLKMMELIFFSDCEGYIGTKASTKLLKEFEDYKIKAIEYSKKNNDEYFLNIYTDFLLAFKIASNNGIVIFS